ncbi:MAG TPA: glycoside hydrolase family 92 protein, partial [Ktedonobacteraceae bacterium]|nr:glycoside hydrolase family 92 protein [Ktedonobacteraceae bacterium]
TSQQTTITVRVGLSFVSVSNAEANVDQENPSGNFDAIAAQAAGTWNTWLNKIRVRGGTPEQIATFYTALYHCLLFPSVFSDVNGEYMGFDGQIYRTPADHAQYANFSGWDIYRSEVQLLALLAPAQASDMAQSLVNNYKQGGLLPKWSVANSETYVQVGDPAAAIIADIYAFGGTDFDSRAALEAMVNQATIPNQARPGLNYLDTPGYLPLDGFYGCCNAYGPASTTLEYNTADFAIGAFAMALGDGENATKFIARAQNWQNLFNPITGYLEPRYKNGEFIKEYSPISNSGWVEGNSAQYTWMVPFNLHDLFAAMGGNARVVQRLDTFFTHVNTGLKEPYAFLGNEPTFEVPWEYNYAGTPYKTQSIVHQILSTLFSSGPLGLPGNDDLGEMSSWYVFAAMGMYPETPGTANLALTSPLFPNITIQRPGGQILQINAPGVSNTTYYVQSLKVNGQLSNKAWLSSSFIANGGTLEYTLARQPDLTWGAAEDDAPPSYS